MFNAGSIVLGGDKLRQGVNEGMHIGASVIHVLVNLDCNAEVHSVLFPLPHNVPMWGARIFARPTPADGYNLTFKIESINGENKRPKKHPTKITML